jgi:hypothetical protein
MIIKVCSNNQVCIECREKERAEEVKKILSIPNKVHCINCGIEFFVYI